MKTKIVLSKSARTFQVWQYKVSLGQLLIRSPKSPATETSPEVASNLDLFFRGTEYMAVPRYFEGLEILPPASDEVQDLELLLGKSLDPADITILFSNGRRFPVVASDLFCSENDSDIFDSLFEF